MKSISRKHHYVPQGYLADFTQQRTKKSQLNVLDIETGRCFRTSPENVASKRDFNRVDIDGHPPDAVENALSGFEGEAIGAIRRVIGLQEFPSEHDLILILNLVALLAVRNPLLRATFNQFRERTLRAMGKALVSSKQMYEKQSIRTAVAGEDLPDVSFEAMRDSVKRDEYDFEFHPQGNLKVEFATLDVLLPLLGRRYWSIFIAPAGGPEFISSDHPVTLTWKGGREGPIGFGLRNTEVFFPLGRNAGLFGTFEDPLDPVVNCSAEVIAQMNTRVANNAELHVFCATPHFYVWHHNAIREVQCVV